MSSHLAVTRRLLGMLAAAMLSLCYCSTAMAHPTSLASATLAIRANGTFQLDLTCDLAAYVMQAKPGHLDGQLAEEFQAMPLEDLESALADARNSLEQRLTLHFDGQPARLGTIDLPDAR